MGKLVKNKKIVPWLVSLLSGILYSTRAVWAQVDWGINEAQNVGLYGSPSFVRESTMWWVVLAIFSLVLILVAIIVGIVVLISKAIKKRKRKGQPLQSKGKGNPKKM